MEEKTFNIDELIKNPEFINQVNLLIKEVETKRNSRPSPGPGLKYKRDFIDRMMDAGALDTYFCLNNIKSIWLKKSNLNSDMRRFVQLVCENALNRMALKIERINQ